MILVDSDVLKAHLRGVDAARDWLIGTRNNGPLAISVVSIAELVGGMRSIERREVWRLLASFRAEPTTEVIARRAGSPVRPILVRTSTIAGESHHGHRFRSSIT